MMARAQHFRWLPPLYFFQALPFFLVTSVSTIFYKQLGISNTTLALASSLFYLPWVLKPFGGPWVQRNGTLKRWIYVTQIILALFAVACALGTTSTHLVWWVSALFMIMAVIAVFHDIGAEGMYLAALSPLDQSWFIGLRATFFRMGWLSMQGLFIAWIGSLQEKGIAIPQIWFQGFFVIAIVFLLFGSYDYFSLPNPKTPVTSEKPPSYFTVLADYFKTPHIRAILGYLLVFRLGEAQLQKLAMPFLLDPSAQGGLGLTTKQVGILYGTFGPFSLTLGGLLGGWLVTKQGLKKWFLPMTVALNLPHVVYVLLSFFPTQDLALVGIAINLEQFFYGFAFTAFLIFLTEVSRRGKYPTASYALGTGLMSFGMMVPGAWSGKLQSVLGYSNFFVWVFLCSIPSLWLTYRAKIVLDEF